MQDLRLLAWPGERPTGNSYPVIALCPQMRQPCPQKSKALRWIRLRQTLSITDRAVCPVTRHKAHPIRLSGVLARYALEMAHENNTQNDQSPLRAVRALRAGKCVRAETLPALRLLFFCGAFRARRHLQPPGGNDHWRRENVSLIRRGFARAVRAITAKK